MLNFNTMVSVITSLHVKYTVQNAETTQCW